MAACWAVEPAPFSVPLSCAALLPPDVLAAVFDSFDAPHAASARVPASAMATGTARDVVLSFNSGPLDMAQASQPGPESNTGKARQPRWTAPECRVNNR